jgi:hypothetical protein
MMEQALARMRQVALGRLAHQRGLRTSPAWLDYALHARSVVEALRLLQSLEGAEATYRFRMKVFCFFFSKKKALASLLTRARQKAS